MAIALPKLITLEEILNGNKLNCRPLLKEKDLRACDQSMLPMLFPLL